MPVGMSGAEPVAARQLPSIRSASYATLQVHACGFRWQANVSATVRLNFCRIWPCEAFLQSSQGGRHRGHRPS